MDKKQKMLKNTIKICIKYSYTVIEENEKLHILLLTCIETCIHET